MLVDLVVPICSQAYAGVVGTIDSGMEQAPRQAQGINASIGSVVTGTGKRYIIPVTEQLDQQRSVILPVCAGVYICDC